MGSFFINLQIGLISEYAPEALAERAKQLVNEKIRK